MGDGSLDARLMVTYRLVNMSTGFGTDFFAGLLSLFSARQLAASLLSVGCSVKS
jgi:hypothetical protein